MIANNPSLVFVSRSHSISRRKKLIPTIRQRHLSRQKFADSLNADSWADIDDIMVNRLSLIDHDAIQALIQARFVESVVDDIKLSLRLYSERLSLSLFNIWWTTKDKLIYEAIRIIFPNVVFRTWRYISL